MIKSLLASYLSLFHGGLISFVLGIFVTLIVISFVFSIINAIKGIFVKNESKKDITEEVKPEEQVLSKTQKIIEILQALGLAVKVQGSQKNTWKWSITDKNLGESFKLTSNGIEFLEPQQKLVDKTTSFNRDFYDKISKLLPLKLGEAGIIDYEVLILNSKLKDEIELIQQMQKSLGLASINLKHKGNKIFIKESLFDELKFNAKKTGNKAVQEILEKNVYIGQVICQWEKGLKGWIHFNYLTQDILDKLNLERRLKDCGLYFEESLGNDTKITYPKITVGASGDILIVKNKESDDLIFNASLKRSSFEFLNNYFDVECRSINQLNKTTWVVTVLKPRKDILFYSFDNDSRKYKAKPIIVYNKAPTVDIATVFEDEEELLQYKTLKAKKDGNVFSILSEEESSVFEKLEQKIISADIASPKFAMDESKISVNGDMLDKLERMIDICVEKSLANVGRVEVFFMGELLNPEQTAPKKFVRNTDKPDESQLFVPIDALKHFLVIGGTGSGKTTTMLSFFYVMMSVCKRLEDDVIVYVADGKNSPDFKVLADYASTYDYAGTIKDPIVELNNVLLDVFKEYVRRQKLFSENEVKDIYAYRELGYKLPRVFVIIDEFAVFKSAMGEFSSSATKGSPEEIIMKLSREARSYGITLFLLGQSPKDESFPNLLKENLTTKIFHKLDSIASGYASTWCQKYSPDKMEQGQFIITGDGFSDPKEVGVNEFVVAMPFLGDYGPKYLLSKKFEIKPHKKFDYDLITNSSKPTENIYDKPNIETLAKFIKKRLVEPEGWEFVWNYDLTRIKTGIFGFVAKKGNLTVGFAFLEKDYYNEYIFTDNNFKMIESKFNPDYYLFFANFDLKDGDKESKKIEQAYGQDIRFQKSYFIEKALFTRFLISANDDFAEQSQVESNHFDNLFSIILSRKNTESHLMKNEAEALPLVFNAGEICKANVQISWNWINTFLKNVSNNDDKGLWFELFVAKLYEKKGYITWLVNELLDAEDSKYTRPNGNTTGDGGGDVIIEDPKTGVRRLVQCKAYFVDPVKKDAYDEVMRSRLKYNCSEVEVITCHSGGKDGFSQPFVNVVEDSHMGLVKFTGNPLPQLLNKPNRVATEPTLWISGHSGLDKLIKEYQQIESESSKLEIKDEEFTDYISGDETGSYFFKNLIDSKVTVKNKDELSLNFTKFCLALLSKTIDGDSVVRIDSKNPNFIIEELNKVPQDIYYCNFDKDFDVSAFKVIRDYASKLKYNRLIILSSADVKNEEIALYKKQYGIDVFGRNSLNKQILILNQSFKPEEDEEDFEDLFDADTFIEEEETDIVEPQDTSSNDTFLNVLDEVMVNALESQIDIPDFDDLFAEIQSTEPETQKPVVKTGRKKKVKTLEEISKLFAKLKVPNKVGKLTQMQKDERDNLEKEFLIKLESQAKDGGIVEITDFEEVNELIKLFNATLEP